MATADINNLSLHLIGGISPKENACLATGVSRIVKGDVYGTMVSGVSNHVGGNASGVLVADLVNRVKGKTRGRKVA